MPTSFPQRGLYAITNGPRHDLLDAVAAAIAGGARAIQYRDTTTDAARRYDEATALLALCRQHAVPLIIEADIALAQRVQADGVHVHSLEALTQARQTLPADTVVGVSCCGSLDTAQAAATNGASYVSFGVCYPSPTLPDARCISHALFTQSATLGIPRVAIGGITADNGAALVTAGADVLASISGVFSATDVQSAARAYLSCF